jgi:hypothetical protein
MIIAAFSANSKRIISSPILARASVELALLGIAPGLEPSTPLLEKDALPALELMGRHLALARHRVERFAQELIN